jgi:hypothetical protein
MEHCIHATAQTGGARLSGTVTRHREQCEAKTLRTERRSLPRRSFRVKAGPTRRFHEHELRAESEFGAPSNIGLRPNLTRKIKIRAAHEVMAARTTELALLVEQLVAALRTISPVFPGKHFVGRCWANLT